MSKELFISSSPHETKVAVLEDDELVEVYHERETGWALAGSIYKGRVTRVLPGMQSAFVDIGLERDAFLYVSALRPRVRKLGVQQHPMRQCRHGFLNPRPRL